MTKVPSDKEADAAWDRIMEIARAHALVVSGAGGCVTLATPAAQRDAGVRDKVLGMHRMVEEENLEL